MIEPERDELMLDEKPMSEVERMRHSAAHVMAEAVLSLFPEGKLAIGPPIEDGFYYDFELPRALTPEDLAEIEKRMAEIVKRNSPFKRSTMSRSEATGFFGERGQDYKLELIRDLGDVPMGIYESDGFVDLCRGPHVESTGKIGYYKLLSVAGAYWRGDEKRPMLQRIYGTAWPSREQLDGHLLWLEEAQRRDHRRLGRDLDIYSISEDVGAGLVLWHPKGGRLRTVIEDFWRKEHYAGGYEIVYTPHIGKAQLWETSGHLGFYRDSMYSPMDVDGQEYYIKPMNCPFHIQIYKNGLRSYRELPLRYSELGQVYRYERAGALHGLMRVRGFEQDDAHIFCRPDQIEEEILGVLDFTRHIVGAFGFEDYEINLSTKPAKAVGDDEMWVTATASLRRALEMRQLAYEVDEGGGAFYGPKIDYKIKDALGRSWQCTTVQFDFNLPERFDLSYIDESGKPHRPYMVHRALLGSMERFVGVLLEHYAGAFPVWLAPVQATLVPIADRHLPYAEAVAAQLKEAGLRVEVDGRREKINRKIRDAQLQKIPYMLVVGDKEIEAGAVAIRLRTGENLGPRTVAEFVALAKEKVAGRSVELV